MVGFCDSETIVQIMGYTAVWPSFQVQSEAAAAVAVVAVADVIKPALVAYGAMPVLIKLTNSQDATLRANAAGAIGGFNSQLDTYSDASLACYFPLVSLFLGVFF